MTRVKRGTTSLKRRRNVLRKTKGYKWGRKSKERAATEALLHAYTHSFNDRRKKKGDFRRLWNVKINAGSREYGISYSKFINMLSKADIKLNRKMLAELAENYPKAFRAVIKEASKEPTEPRRTGLRKKATKQTKATKETAVAEKPAKKTAGTKATKKKPAEKTTK